MKAITYTKSGTLNTTKKSLDDAVFNAAVTTTDAIKQAYTAYLNNGRPNLAKTLRRGEVSGGGKKPWKQKGTGRARFGSSRVPIWRKGGIVFGPLGSENYSKILSKNTKRAALRNALSVKNASIVILEEFDTKEAKTANTVSLLNKIGARGNVLLVVSTKDDLVSRATRNVEGLKVVQATYLNVFDVMNADSIVITEKSVELIEQWLTKKESK